MALKAQRSVCLDEPQRPPLGTGVLAAPASWLCAGVAELTPLTRPQGQTALPPALQRLSAEDFCLGLVDIARELTTCATTAKVFGIGAGDTLGNAVGAGTGW